MVNVKHDNSLRRRHAKVVCDRLRVGSVVVYAEAEGKHVREQHCLRLRCHFGPSAQCSVRVERKRWSAGVLIGIALLLREPRDEAIEHNGRNPGKALLERVLVADGAGVL